MKFTQKKELIDSYGTNPFKPPIEEFKKDKNHLGKLIDFYIDLTTTKSRNEYLKEAHERKLIRNCRTALN